MLLTIISICTALVVVAIFFIEGRWNDKRDLSARQKRGLIIDKSPTPPAPGELDNESTWGNHG